MIRATLRFKARAGREEEFVAAWRQISEGVRRTPGNLRQTLLRDRDDPSCFVITSDWETLDAFRSFERSPEQDALTAPLRDLRESAAMTVHDIVVHVTAPHNATVGERR